MWKLHETCILVSINKILLENSKKKKNWKLGKQWRCNMFITTDSEEKIFKNGPVPLLNIKKESSSCYKIVRK